MAADHGGPPPNTASCPTISSGIGLTTGPPNSSVPCPQGSEESGSRRSRAAEGDLETDTHAGDVDGAPKRHKDSEAVPIDAEVTPPQDNAPFQGTPPPPTMPPTLPHSTSHITGQCFSNLRDLFLQVDHSPQPKGPVPWSQWSGLLDITRALTETLTLQEATMLEQAARLQALEALVCTPLPAQAASVPSSSPPSFPPALVPSPVPPPPAQTPTLARPSGQTPTPPPRASYADHLRASLARETNPVAKANLARQALAHRPMPRRLIPAETPLTETFQERVAGVRTVWVRGLNNRCSYSAMREVVHAFCPSLRPKDGQYALLFIGYAGPLTEFVVSTPAAAETLSAAFVTEFGPRSVLTGHRPELPLRSDCHSDAIACTAASDAYIRRMTKAIQGTNNLLLATYLHRRVPSLASSVSAALGLRARGSSGTSSAGPRATVGG
jgi:hypothetical protein